MLHIILVLVAYSKLSFDVCRKSGIALLGCEAAKIGKNPGICEADASRL